MVKPIVLRMIEDLQSQLDDGTHTGGAPIPRTIAGIGQWITSNAAMLPIGGTWAYVGLVGSGLSAVAVGGVAPGGIALPLGSARFFAWRVL